MLGNPVTPVSLLEAGPTDRTVDRRAAALPPMGTGSPSAEAGFAAVDDATDPISLVHYLDRMSGQLDGVKRQIRQQLEVGEGEFVLDVGCGAGDEACGLSALVGLSGRIIGVDASTTMVQEARRRATGSAVAVGFAIGDAQTLPFAAASFDACRAERVLQHLRHPALAVTEMARVTRAGGRVVVCEPDWQTLVVDHPDHALTQRILDFRAGTLQSPWIGRQLARLFRCAGLVEISMRLVSVAFGLPEAIESFRLEVTLRQATQAGVITATDKSHWLAELTETAQTGCFVAAATCFLVRGIKPFGA